MKSQQTIAVVFAVRKTDCFMFTRSSFDFLRYQSPGTRAPASVPPIEPATSSDAQASSCHHPRVKPTANPTRLHHQT